MREFFKGWKRKAGCVTLVMACLFMFAWLRSISVVDWIQWDQDRIQLRAVSENGLFSFEWTQWRRQASFRHGASVRNGSKTIVHYQYLFHYAFFGTPLIFLSGWLLLSKTRPAKMQLATPDRPDSEMWIDTKLKTMEAAPF